MKDIVKQFVSWFEDNMEMETWLDPETDQWKPYTELPEYRRLVETLERDETPVKAKYVDEIHVDDPDTGLPVHVAIYKMETGGMVGIDSSFLENTDLDVFSPYDEGITLKIEE